MKMGGRKYKKSNSFYKMFVERFADLGKYFAAHGDTNVHRGYITAEGYHLGNWVHDQRKKYNSGTLTNSRIKMLAPLNFQFQKQRNVVGDKFTVPVAIAAIFKYKKELGSTDVPKADPYKHPHRLIIHAKTVSKKII
jgi:hypothetical protein